MGTEPATHMGSGHPNLKTVGFGLDALTPKRRVPSRLEHEYKRAETLHLFAAFDTRTGLVYTRIAQSKRQEEFTGFLEQRH